MNGQENLEIKCINAIRFLAADAIEKAKSGHPGMPMGAAAAAYTLWTRRLKYNPADPLWPDRDRFVLSAGHASMLLYALLYLTGYDLSLDDLKAFRQWGSKTPGHPERHPAGEMTTGPLGRGRRRGRDSRAEAHLAAGSPAGISCRPPDLCFTGGRTSRRAIPQKACRWRPPRPGTLVLYDDNRI